MFFGKRWSKNRQGTVFRPSIGSGKSEKLQKVQTMTKYRANRSKSVFWLAHPYEKNFFHIFLCFYGSLYHFEPHSNRGKWILWIEVQNERA